MNGAERILVIAHGHPEMIRGGGEIAAYQLFQAYRENVAVEQASFLARADFGRGASGRMRMHRAGEYLWEQGLSNAFMMQAANLHEVTGYFAELLRNLRPTVVHSHHYFMLGLEYLKVIKDIDPAIKLVLTLHEYMAICPNAGLFVKPGSGELCRSGDYRDHIDCAPDKAPEDLWLRKHRFDSYFAYVDQFIAPSEFLRQRYIEWGLAPERITLVANGQPERKPIPPRPLEPGEGRNRFGYFGQINEHKGLDVLLAGLNHLKKSQRRRLVLEVHGANLDYQPEEFQARIKALAEPLVKEGTLLWMGGYMPSELPERMASIDWVLVPSVWYENAPLVIQEAFGFGRPVIASNIGGMKEAVTDGVNGLTLPRGNGPQWASTLHRLATETETWDRLHRQLPRPVSLQQTTQRMLDLFQTLGLQPA